MRTALAPQRKFRKAYGGTMDPNDPRQMAAFSTQEQAPDNSTIPSIGVSTGIAKKKPLIGGTQTPDQLSAISAGSTLVGGVADAFDSGNSYGHQSGLATGLKQGASMAATGAAIGSVIPGLGTVAGGVIGGAIGLTEGLISSGKAHAADRAMDRSRYSGTLLAQQRQGNARIAADPSLVYGQRGAQDFAYGGDLNDGPPTDTLKVNNLSDPRLKAYKDSLTMFKQNKLSEAVYNKDDIHLGNTLSVDRAIKHGTSMLYGKVIGNNRDYTNTIHGPVKHEFNGDADTYNRDISTVANKPIGFRPIAENNGKMDPGYRYNMVAVYKKPTQPVVYQKPTISSGPPTISTNNPLMVQKADGSIAQWGNPIPPTPVPTPISQGGKPPIVPSDKAKGSASDYYSSRDSRQGKEVPSIPHPNNPWYADGGQLPTTDWSNQQVPGGSLTPLNSQAVAVNGQSHEQGGVQLPQAEVEGGESISKGFVFSDELGFAALHKPIARAIGKIEDKPMNPIRRKTMEILQGREQGLALSQEFLKQRLGIQ